MFYSKTLVAVMFFVSFFHLNFFTSFSLKISVYKFFTQTQCLQVLACFFLCGSFLKRLPADVRSHLVHYRTTDPPSLALCTNEIYQSRVSSASPLNHISSPSSLNHISSAPALNYVSSALEECPILAVNAPPASHSCA